MNSTWLGAKLGGSGRAWREVMMVVFFLERVFLRSFLIACCKVGDD